MKLILKTAVVATTLLASTHVFAQQIMLYQNDGWRGRAVNISGNVNDLRRVGFNDLASSVVVERGQWEVCDDVHFRGNCRVLRRGNYESLSGMGLNDRISSLRPVGRNRQYNNEAPAPLPQANYEYRRRSNERVYEARVTSVRAVVGQDEQRCWIDRQQVTTQGGGSSTAGALAGALIGGVLGHQVGDGRGRDYATAGGAIAGAVVGSNMGSGNTQYGTRDVRRCENVASTTPTYWDVNYVYRGVEHNVQLAHAPGNTIPVNSNGLPRM